MDLDLLAKKTGVAKNHLIDIEAGSGRAFHSLAYCRKAIDMVAREFGLEQQVAEAWREEDWIVPEVRNPRLASLEASPPALLPSHGADLNGQARRWAAPLAGLIGLAVVAWLAMGRIDQDPEAPSVGGSSSAPIVAKAPESAATGPVAALPTPAPSANPPAAAPSAAPSPPAPAKSASLMGPRQQVESAMAEWARLWQARQAEPYAAFYDPSFAGLDRHLGIRRNRMAQAAFIKVEVSELQFRETGPGEITVRFRQIYRSDSYQSDDRKEIVWRATGQGPKITAERLVN